MSAPGRRATEYVVNLLRAPGGLAASLAWIASREGKVPAEVLPEQIRGQNISSELAEKTAGVHYPAIYVYCERLSNDLKEKFRTFAGRIRMVIEARVSKDRLEDLDAELQRLSEAIAHTLDTARGNWGEGLCYPGGYEVTYSPIRHGGKNFLQSAKIAFEVDARQD
ncbi:MAG: hypothetical protein RMK57_16220 [Bryobacterales bacterium]|nr:hypothetical protein [Bryobacteraceae bacterium]MDW8356069.1 hypothetical protein [Bryobacterales bacterium]